MLASILLGLLLWAGMHHEYAIGRAKGKAAFLAWQAERFDKYDVKPGSAIGGCVVGIAFAGTVFGAYEGLALVIFMAIRPRGKSALAMPNDSSFRESVRAHLNAGFLAVTGIAGLGAACLFPLVLAASSKGVREATFSAGLVLVGALAFAVAVWLLFYVPLSVVAEMITKGRSAQLWLSALLCMIGLGSAVLALTHRYDQPPHLVARISLLVVSVLLGLGCALYSFLKRWLAERIPKERNVAP